MNTKKLLIPMFALALGTAVAAEAQTTDVPATAEDSVRQGVTHRDGFPRLSARRAWRGDAGHRKPWAPSESYGPAESLGKPPFRSRGRTGSGRIGEGVGKP